jgi:hypothetical protein
VPGRICVLRARRYEVIFLRNACGRARRDFDNLYKLDPVKQLTFSGARLDVSLVVVVRADIVGHPFLYAIYYEQLEASRVIPVPLNANPDECGIITLRCSRGGMSQEKRRVYAVIGPEATGERRGGYREKGVEKEGWLQEICRRTCTRDFTSQWDNPRASNHYFAFTHLITLENRTPAASSLTSYQNHRHRAG